MFAENVFDFFKYNIVIDYPKYVVDSAYIKEIDDRVEDELRRLTLKDFYRLKKEGNHGSLVKFHSDYKYLLMAYHEQGMRSLGRITANKKQLSFKEVISSYERILLNTLKNNLDKKSCVNAFMHGFGHLSDHLSSREKDFFLKLIDDYRNNRILITTLQEVLYFWATRHDVDYLRRQRLINHYPLRSGPHSNN